MKGIKPYIIAGIILVSALGTFLHFAYDLSGNNFLVALFAPVNESIWEHTKLIFFPMLLYSAYLNQKLKLQYPCISSAMLSVSLLGVLLIIILFYTYFGIIGYHIAFVDIAIFYISVIASFYVAYKLTLSCKAERFYGILQAINLIMICLYIIFTFSPPNYPLFIAP